MENIIVDVEKEFLDKINGILDEEGVNLSIATKMFLKKIEKEKSIGFLFSNKVDDGNHDINSDNINSCVNEGNNTSNSDISKNEVCVSNYGINKMTKSIAIRMFLREGFKLDGAITYASKNKGAYNYWANPEFDVLNYDWNLILNDWMKKIIYLFQIPAGSLKKHDLVSRADKDYMIDLQIMYGDITFTDNRSGYSFVKFLTKQIKY